jgi:hypothetical protein
MSAFGYDHRVPGLVGDSLAGQAGAYKKNKGQFSGRPKQVLNWSPQKPSGSTTYDGSFAGVDHVIESQTVRVQDKDSGGSGVGTVSLTTSGLRLQQTGASGKSLMILFDLSSLPGMSETYNNTCITASFTVTTFTNASASINLFALQDMPVKPSGDFTQYDIQCQAQRYSSSNYRVKAYRRNNATAATGYNYTNNNLSSSGQPSAVRLTLFGSNYTWWAGGDTTNARGLFQTVGLGTNQRKWINMNGNSHLYFTGIDHPYIGVLVGRGETTANDIYLTNLSVWTYGNTE